MWLPHYNATHTINKKQKKDNEINVNVLHTDTLYYIETLILQQ